MAKDLNVSLGLLTENFKKGLKSARRDLRSFARRTEEVGSTLTRSLSIPLGGAAIAAIKSAADFEKLEKQLTSVTGSADASAQQIARLKEIAEAPGLGFEQAVSAAARLQAVGLNAQQAESAIAEFGNAVARSGGGAVEFDGAILALTQIASKGKISAEEINQLNERIFEIRPALERAFGTSSSEELQKLGISSEEFIAKVTEEFSKLDRVQGGLANAFENLGIGVKSFLAEVGGVIVELFPVQDIVSRITDGLNRLAERFKALPEPTQRTILAVAGLAAAIGPLILAVSSIAAGLAAFASPLALTVAAIAALSAAFVVAYNQSEVFRDTVQVLGLVIKTIVVNAFETLVSIISSVSKALGLSNNKVKETEGGFSEFGAKSVLSITKVINTFKVLFKFLTFGPRLVLALVKSIVSLFNRVIEVARGFGREFGNALSAENPIDRLRGIIKAGANLKILKLGKDIGSDFATNIKEAVTGSNIDAFFDKVARDVASAQERINARRFAAAKEVTTPTGTGAGTETPAPISGGGGGGLVIDTKSLVNGVSQAVGSATAISRAGLDQVKTDSQAAFSGLLQGVSQAGEQGAIVYNKMGEVITNTLGKANKLANQQKLYNNALSKSQIIADKLGGTFDAVFTAIQQGKNTFKAFRDGLKQVVLDLIKAAAKAAIFAAITSIIFPSAGSFSGVFKSLFSGFTGIPIGKAASGGIVTRSQILNVGEEGAEAIIPLDRINEIGGMGGEVRFTIEGTDLVGVLKNNEDTYNRIF